MECGQNENSKMTRFRLLDFFYKQKLIDYDSSTVDVTGEAENPLQSRKKFNKKRSTVINESHSPINPKKRMKICTSTSSESDFGQDNDRIVIKKPQSQHREKKVKSSRKVVGKVGKFLTKISTNWREQRKKLKSKLFRKKRLPKTQNTSAGIFMVTSIKKEKLFENVSGFKVIPTYQDFKDDLM